MSRLCNVTHVIAPPFFFEHTFCQCSSGPHDAQEICSCCSMTVPLPSERQPPTSSTSPRTCGPQRDLLGSCPQQLPEVSLCCWRWIMPWTMKHQDSVQTSDLVPLKACFFFGLQAIMASRSACAGSRQHGAALRRRGRSGARSVHSEPFAPMTLFC